MLEKIVGLGNPLHELPLFELVQRMADAAGVLRVRRKKKEDIVKEIIGHEGRSDDRHSPQQHRNSIHALLLELPKAACDGQPHDAIRMAIELCSPPKVNASPMRITLRPLGTAPRDPPFECEEGPTLQWATERCGVPAPCGVIGYCPPQTTLKAPGKPTKPPVRILRQPGRT